MSKVHIPIEAHFGFTTKRKGKVVIDRASRTIEVRAFRSEPFILPLEEVADMISFKILQSKALEGRQAKKRRVRRMVSRGLLSTGR